MIHVSQLKWCILILFYTSYKFYNNLIYSIIMSNIFRYRYVIYKKLLIIN